MPNHEKEGSPPWDVAPWYPERPCKWGFWKTDFGAVHFSLEQQERIRILPDAVWKRYSTWLARRFRALWLAGYDINECLSDAHFYRFRMRRWLRGLPYRVWQRDGEELPKPQYHYLSPSVPPVFSAPIRQ